MEFEKNFYDIYIGFAGKAELLSKLPIRQKDEEDASIFDIECFGNHLSNSLPILNKYPSLVNSLFSLIEHNDMTGYLGVFIIENSISSCDELCNKENQILFELDRIDKLTANIQQKILIEIRSKVLSWRRVITLENMNYIRRFLDALQKQTDEIYESLSAQDKLGKALALSEEERKRLLAQEEARQRGISEKEFEKEEKRRQAKEEYSKKINIRKKK
jgi:hypothetical protein